MRVKAAGVSRFLIKTSGITILLLLWEIAPRAGLADSKILPPLSTVLQVFPELWREDSLFRNAMVSLWRVVLGLIISSVFAIPAGMFLGYRRDALLASLDPLFRILGQVNPFSLLPVFLMLFGVGETAKLAIAVWVCFWPVLHNTVQGVRTVDAVLVRTALSMRAPYFVLVLKVLVPGAALSIFTGFRLGAQLCFFMMMAGEMLGATAGLGWLLHTYGHYFVAPKIYGVGMCIVLLGILLNRCLKLLEDGVLFWKERKQVFRSFLLSERGPRRTGKRGAVLAAAFIAALLIVGSIQAREAAEASKNYLSHPGHEVNK